MKMPKLYITSEVRAKFPDLQEAMMPVCGVTVKRDEQVLTENDFENLLKGKLEQEFFDQSEFELFREFAKDLKIDLKKNPPSVEFLYKQHKKTGRIPHINSVVDSANKVALETLVATGTFDMDKIEGDMQLRFTREGEEFKPLGGDIEYLPAGLVVIADEKRILNLFPFRDSIYQKITEKTKNVLILADKMPGQDLEKVKDAVRKVADLLEEKCGGKKGEMYLAEEGDSFAYSVGLKDLEKTKGVKRVFAGMRATGRLHLGNYLGGAKGMLALQDNPNLETVYMVADMHGITTPYDVENMRKNRREIVLDYLAVGLDPDKSIIFEQSENGYHGELAFYLSSVVTIARMQHLPTFKEKVKQYPQGSTMALLNYPILMASDILLYKAGLVPVGIDQEPHLEVAREIARKMNDQYGTVFPEPKRFTIEGNEYVPSLTGEGKMSKSVEGSYINLSDSLEDIKEKLAKVPTDSGKGLVVVSESLDLIRDLTSKFANDKETVRRLMNGKEFPIYLSNGGVKPAFGVKSLMVFVELFQGEAKRKEYEDKYQSEGVRYGELKSELAEAIHRELKPIQEKRKEFENNPELVDKILKEGAEKARKIASETVKEVKEKMGLA